MKLDLKAIIMILSALGISGASLLTFSQDITGWLAKKSMEKSMAAHDSIITHHVDSVVLGYHTKTQAELDTIKLVIVEFYGAEEVAKRLHKKKLIRDRMFGMADIKHQLGEDKQ